MKLKALFILILFNSHSVAQFWDQGLKLAQARTEFEIGKGTGNDWLALTYSSEFEGAENCKFDANSAFGCPGRAGLPNLPNGNPVWLGGHQYYEACNGDDMLVGDSWLGCITYSESPYFEINNPLSDFWVIGANDDPAFDQCKKGPPNLSHQIYNYNSLDSGIFMIGDRTVINPDLSTKKVIKMGVHNSDHDFYCDINQDYELGTIPFLSFGAQKDRGNNTAVGSLASKHHGGFGKISFKAQVVDYSPLSCPVNEFPNCPIATPNNPIAVGAHAGIFIIATWDDTHHMLFVDLLRTGIFETYSSTLTSEWNWPIEDSFYYPGSRIVIQEADAEFLDTNNNSVSSCFSIIPKLALQSAEPQQFDIDASRLFECAIKAGYYPEKPDGHVEIEGVHWFVETAGPKGELSIEIQDIFMNQDDLIFRDPFD